MADNDTGTPGASDGQAGSAAGQEGTSAPSSGEQNPFDFGDQTSAPVGENGQGEGDSTDADNGDQTDDGGFNPASILEQFGNDPTKLAKSYHEMRAMQTRVNQELGEYRKYLPKYQEALKQRDQILNRLEALAGPEIKALIKQKLGKTDGQQLPGQQQPPSKENPEDRPMTKAEMIRFLQEREESRQAFQDGIDTFKSRTPDWESHSDAMHATMNKYPALADMVVEGKLPIDVIYNIAKGMSVSSAMTQARKQGLKEGLTANKARRDSHVEGPSQGAAGAGGDDPWADLK